jgi:ZIP family zinc transporter
MFTAFAWGLGAAGSLIIGAALASYLKIPRRLLGLIMAFGVGVLISAVSFELAEEAFTASHRGWAVAAGLAAGALVFFIGDSLISRMGGRAHRAQQGESGSGLAILLGTILDGIPESVVIGLALVNGGSISVAMVVAVFLSNLPEAVGATSGLLLSGWSKRRVFGLWLAVAVVSGAAAWVGFAFFDTASSATLAFTLAFAAGALLTMIADSMMPEAFKDSGKGAGLVTTLGFGLAFLISMLS